VKGGCPHAKRLGAECMRGVHPSSSLWENSIRKVSDKIPLRVEINPGIVFYSQPRVDTKLNYIFHNKVHTAEFAELSSLAERETDASASADVLSTSESTSISQDCSTAQPTILLATVLFHCLMVDHTDAAY
jgi:hypothetical protein